MKNLTGIFFLLFFSVVSFAQIEISKETELYNGKLYYIHLIKPGQTVYSIAKAYQVSTDDIFEANSFAQNGIQPGQYLKIPVKNPELISEDNNVQETPLPTDTIFLLTYVADNDILVSQLTEQFRFSPSEFLGYNPEFKNQKIIRKNEILKLPVRSSDILIEYLLQKPHAQVIILLYHSVKKGETLFSIGREYGCAVSELMFFNPGLAEHLKEGQQIRVPSKDIFSVKQITEKIPTPDCMVISKKAHYNVALLVPFYLEKAGNIVIDSDPRKNVNKNFQSFEYIQFYEGFLLAMNTIDMNQATIDLKVYDITEGNKKIQNLISRGVLDVDLIIGPFHKEPLEILSEWSKDKNVRILDLYLPDEIDYTLENQNILRAIPSVTMQLKGLLSYINEFIPEKNVIFVYSENNQNESLLIEKVRELNTLNPAFEIHFLPYNSYGISGLVKQLSHDTQNIIVSFTNNEVFLNNFSRLLFDNAEKYPITLFGIPSWLKFESIEYRYLNHFNTHFFSSHFVDYTDPKVIEFIKQFQETYLTDPNRLAFLGNDVATWTLGALTTYGTDFIYCTEKYQPALLSTKFVFERTRENGQLQNMNVCIYEIIEYQLFDSKKVIKKEE